MKLLLVDDEIITRKGLINSIDWKALQIHQILEADDGIQALSIARTHSPEIVLTDIRMPRMDGIIFAERLREFLPNTSIIFMSGYSDKDYLRAAIRLKAVSYVEKPINNLEITSAVQEAVRHHELLERSAYSQHIQHQENSAQVALALTRPLPADSGTLMDMIRSLDLPLDSHTCFLSLLVKTFPPFSGPGDTALTAILDKLHTLTRTKPFHFIHALKYDSTLILTLYADAPPSSSSVMDFIQYLKQLLEETCSFFLAVGPCVRGIERAYESYNQAAVLLQFGFFCDYNTILTEQKPSPASTVFPEEDYHRFCEYISRKESVPARQCADSLFRKLMNSRSFLPSMVKDVYFNLFNSLEEAYHIQLISSQENTAPIWDRIQSCNTLPELHNMLSEELTSLDAVFAASRQESDSVSLMKDYIHKNYPNPSLSVKDISDHAHLSVAYACTVFKTETGKTMNQYLTEYRMDKARQLLNDPRIKIVEISSRIGYMDGNYFGKSFKKITGLSPSEYREKIVK
ncbi:MAG: response regulator [Lachnospiraceae bacterium]|nr:response regulator [Lachnospiraceae bacterium]